MLDDSLRQILTNFLVKDEKESKENDIKLFENIGGPFSTFSARIQASYRLGLISKTEKDELDLIRDIRNKFAHQVELSSFDDEWTKNQCYKLRPGRIDGSLSPRTSFTFSVLLLKRALNRRALEAEQERRKLKDDI